jgi:hypothetical protein
MIVTSVDATVDEDMVDALREGYRELSTRSRPAGLISTQLLRGQNDNWRIQTTWRDRASLLELRKSGEPPAALELLDRVGATHTHAVFVVEQCYGD